MPPIIQNNELPRNKRILRYSLHVLHFLVGTFLLASLLLDIYIRLPITPKSKTSPLYIHYLFPTTILILFSESCYLFRRRPSFLANLEESRLAPRDLRRRSFLYQLCGVFLVGWSNTKGGERDYSRALGWMKDLGFGTWFIGVFLFALAAASREYRFKSWVEEPRWVSNSQSPRNNVEDASNMVIQPDQESSEADEDIRGKRITRYAIHIIHLFLILILLSFVIVNYCSMARMELTFYLLPFIFITFMVEIPYLFFYGPSQRLLENFIATPTLKARSFAYQLCGAFAMGWSGDTSSYWYDAFIQASWQLGFLVWISGLALFAIAIASEEYGFQAWVDEVPRDIEEIGVIRLEYDSDNEANGPQVVPDSLA